jgi:hypothetical protein
MRMQPLATATRCVAAFAPTSTMCACPWASKWVSGEGEAGVGGDIRVYVAAT